jgi:hypothetical protein
MSCHVSENPNIGPDAAHDTIMTQHRIKVTGLPAACAVIVAAWAKAVERTEGWGRMNRLREGRAPY